MLLLNAARRLEPLDPELAQECHLEALLATIYAGRLAPEGAVADVAAAAPATSLDRAPRTARQLLLRGLTTRFTDGYAAGAPTLRAALHTHRLDDPQLDWLSVLYTVAAQDLWDDEAWLALASRQAELARATGTLSLLPYALDYLAGYHLHAGDLSAAAGLLSEAEGLAPGLRAETLPYIPLLLAAWRGEASTVARLGQTMTTGAPARGEGCAITVAGYAAAVLHNGLGDYRAAFECARQACSADEIATSSWALPELVEAASRTGHADVAADAAKRLAERAHASDTAWAKGTAAHALALVSETGAEALHQEAIRWLGQSRVATHLARSRLSYGKWLRRAGRRVDARDQLRPAYQQFATMGAKGFAERARRELLATGEKVRKRRDDARDELTPQELHIAWLARDGHTNQEIGAKLFISDRTVEWHLGKVFAKLSIASRRGLQAALSEPGRQEDTGTAPVSRPA